MLPDIAARLLKWENEHHAGPWRLKVFPTYRCNIKCGICVRNWCETPRFLFDELPDERWLRLVDEAASLGVRILTIGGGGEPMLRASLVREMCIKAKEYGMEGALQTNGTLLDREIIESLVLAGWDCVTLSIDAPYAESNDAIRDAGVFNKTLTALEMLHEIKRKHGKEQPTVAIHMTITALNYAYLEEMVPFCLDNHVQMLSASPLLEGGMESTEYVLHSEARSNLPEIIERAIEKADAGGLPHTLNSLLMLDIASRRKSMGSPRGCQGMQNIATAHCLEPWTSLTVISSGHASPCCFFWDEDADSLRDKTLQEVWTGPYLSSFRQQMSNGPLPGYCRHCYYPNTQEHRDLLEFFQQTAARQGASERGWRILSLKAWKSLRKYGLWASLKRYLEWRAIQKSLRKD